MAVDMEKLVQAIRDHSGMKDDEIREAAQRGGNAGWYRFTFAEDCVTFYEKNKRDIWELLADRADEAGMKPLELVASFHRIARTPDGFATVLAWFTLEEAGWWLENNHATASEPDNDAD